MARRSVILLPPSEAKAPGGSGPPWHPGTMAMPELDGSRADVLRALGRRHEARTGPTLPAIERYTGVLYKELDAASLPASARRRLDRSVHIASGLWGMVTPRDPIPFYKLKMSANVAPLGRLSTWWRPRLTPALAPTVRGATVWDLLALEHRAALAWNELEPAQQITVRFVDASDRVVSHWNKLLKGALVRWLVTSGASDLAALQTFDHPLGYRLDPQLTTHDGTHTSVTLRARA